MNNVRKLTDEGSGVGIYTFGFLETELLITSLWALEFGEMDDNVVSELSTQRLQMYR